MVRRSWLTPASIAGALLDRALDARFHLQERAGGAAHFARAARPEVRGLAALAEAFGGVGQPQDRLDLVAQEQHRDDQQDRRGADHPEQEDLRIRGIGRAALGEYAHHRIVKLNADFDQIGAADGIDPERLADLAAEFDRQRLVQQREERFWAGRRHVADRQEIDHQVQPLLRDPPQLRAVLVLRINRVDVDQSGDVLHHRRRQPPRHRVPVPLHEHERHHRLQHHHRHDHDQKRAGVEPGRHPALEGVAPSSHWLRKTRPAAVRIRVRPVSSVLIGRGSLLCSHCQSLMAMPPGDSRRRVPPAGTRDWPDRARSCAAAG